MDVTQNKAVLNEFNLPPEDYNAKGQVRVLRKRVLKKLFKYEFKAIFPTLWIVIGILTAVTALTVCSMIFKGDDASLILPIILYAYSVLAVTLTPIILAGSRYSKNFFKSQGYLTFSIPASAEEHIFAKHVTALLGLVVSLIATFISVIIVLVTATILFDFGGAGGGEGVVAPMEMDFLTILEMIVDAILSPIVLVCAIGAVECWEQKFTKKRQIFFRILIAYFVISALGTALAAFASSDLIEFFYTPLGAHLYAWFSNLFLVGVIVFCVWYELRTFKKKLNLK